MSKNKGDRSVVRNQAYQKKGISIRQRHNERKNETYYNADIDLSRSHMNIRFRENLRLDDAGDYVIAESYAETFDRLLAEGKINTRGLKADAKVIDEMVFDVNTDYFDRNGGYEYAKSFFEEAYRCAVNEIGGEEYVISAIMHADERNSALSEKLGRDVYHYEVRSYDGWYKHITLACLAHAFHTVLKNRQQEILFKERDDTEFFTLTPAQSSLAEFKKKRGL